MRRITGSLVQARDGVIQALGGPEEDRTGFMLVRWSFPYVDDPVDTPMGRPFDCATRIRARNVLTLR